MQKHSFKIIKTPDSDNAYRIIDLIDTDIMAKTEFYEDYDEFEKRWAVSRNKEIKEGSTIGAKVIGYNIFILLDNDNVPNLNNIDKKYLSSILKQMAIFFKENEIVKNPRAFDPYALPTRKSGIVPNKNESSKRENEIVKNPRAFDPYALPTRKSGIVLNKNESSKREKDFTTAGISLSMKTKKRQPKKLSGWRTALIIIGSVLTLALITSIILWPDTWKTIIICILTLPMTIIMLLAFADDMFKRR